MTENADMDFAIDPITMMKDGYGFVVRNGAKEPIVSVCYVTHKEAEEARSMMQAVLAKAVAAHSGGRR